MLEKILFDDWQPSQKAVPLLALVFGLMAAGILIWFYNEG